VTLFEFRQWFESLVPVWVLYVFVTALLAGYIVVLLCKWNSVCRARNRKHGLKDFK